MTQLVQKTADLHAELKKARVTVEWDGSRGMLDLIKKRVHSNVELAALGVRNYVMAVLEDLIKDPEQHLENLDTIILKDTGETVLVIVNVTKSKYNKETDDQWVKFIVNPKNPVTGLYHWPTYCPEEYNGASMIVHHIHQWKPKQNSNSSSSILSWFGF